MKLHRQQFSECKKTVSMTEINLKHFDKALDAAKESCQDLGRHRTTDPAVEATLSNLIYAIEMLADAVNSHYHSEPDQDTP